jgi:hypothetical protein
MIWERGDSCGTVPGVLVPPTLASSVQEERHFGHKLLHSRAAVVTRRVVLQVFPEPLDAIVVGPARLQKVELNPAGFGQL